MSFFQKKADHSNLGYIIIIAAALLICAVAIFYASQQRFRLDRDIRTLKGETVALKKSLSEVASKGGASASEWRTVSTKALMVRLGTLQLVHQCAGDILPSPGDSTGPSRPYCLGKNRLILVTSGKPLVKDERSVTIDERNVENAEDAPLLSDLFSINQLDDYVLIAYAPNACTTTGDCGAGMPSNYITFVYDVNAGKARPINHYPANGVAFWNQAGTKALFPVVQIGGAGADVAPIVGYDLVRDTAKELTKETGAEIGQEQPADVNGKPVAKWLSVGWTGADTWSAKLALPDGTVKEIKGKF